MAKVKPVRTFGEFSGVGDGSARWTYSFCVFY